MLGVPEDELLDERRAVWDGLEFVERRGRRRPAYSGTGFRTPGSGRRATTIRVHDAGHETRIGEIVSVDYSARTIDIKKQSKKLVDEHPSGVVLHRHVRTEGASRRAEGPRQHGAGEPDSPSREPYRSAAHLLLRRPLRQVVGTQPTWMGEDTVQAAARIALALDGEVLAIQGPPGTGKTYAGGEIISTLVENGLKVGVTAVSHKVIVNLLESAAERAARSRARACGSCTARRGEVRR